jgi:hypothetical protein
MPSDPIPIFCYPRSPFYNNNSHYSLKLGLKLKQVRIRECLGLRAFLDILRAYFNYNNLERMGTSSLMDWAPEN